MKIYCEECNKKIEKTRPNKRFCCKKCKDINYKKRMKNKKKALKIKSAPQKIGANFKNKKEILNHSLNGLNGDFKAIERYKKLAEDICILMRGNRISKYSNNAQNLIIDIMVACHKHLSNELRDLDLNKTEVDLLNKKKEVIDIDWK